MAFFGNCLCCIPPTPSSSSVPVTRSCPPCLLSGLFPVCIPGEHFVVSQTEFLVWRLCDVGRLLCISELFALHCMFGGNPSAPSTVLIHWLYPAPRATTRRPSAASPSPSPSAFFSALASSACLSGMLSSAFVSSVLDSAILLSCLTYDRMELSTPTQFLKKPPTAGEKGETTGGLSARFGYATPPPPTEPCETNALVGTTEGAVSATLGTMSDFALDRGCTVRCAKSRPLWTRFPRWPK